MNAQTTYVVSELHAPSDRNGNPRRIALATGVDPESGFADVRYFALGYETARQVVRRSDIGERAVYSGHAVPITTRGYLDILSTLIGG